MTDREMLELAAKAAGMNRRYTEWLGQCGLIDDDPNGGYWNALEDDGGAFRLAVKLEFTIHRHPNKIGISQYGKGRHLLDPWQELITDELEATRRAIVRAAAGIGKGML